MVQTNKILSKLVEASSGGTPCLFDIDETTFESYVDMIKSLEVELRDRAPFSYFDIVVFIFSERHALVDNIGKVNENILDLLLFPIDFCLEILDLPRNNLGLFHQCRGFLFLLSRLGDCRCDLVPFLPQLISFCLEIPPFSIELQYELHLVQLVRQAPLPQALPDYLGVLPHELDVQQDGFGLKILPVGKKTNVHSGCAKTFQGPRPLSQSQSWKYTSTT